MDERAIATLMGKGHLFVIELNDGSVLTAHLVTPEGVNDVLSGAPYLHHVVATSYHTDLEVAADWCHLTENALLCDLFRDLEELLAA